MLKHKDEEEAQPWDKQKIFVALLTVLVLFFAFLYFKEKFLPPTTAVEGTSITENPKIPQSSQIVSDKIQANIDKLKQNVNDLNVAEIASSSPQVQKIIGDIKALQNYPQSQAREACQKICQGL